MRCNTFFCLLSLFFVFSIVYSLTISEVRIRKLNDGTYICRSVDIRNSVSMLKLLRNCSVVEGFVRIVLMNYNTSVSFPELKEITCYLLLYRVSGIQSIGQLFPQLTVIRGMTLFHNYALTIYEMTDLKEIGLYNLVKILRGGVRIERNSELCYVDTVNWSSISQGDHYIKFNRDRETCQKIHDCDKGCKNCWSQNKCQVMDQPGNCHPLCLGQCYGTGYHSPCTVCRYFDVDGKCVRSCPADRYEYLGRRCVTKFECRNMSDPFYFPSPGGSPCGISLAKPWWPVNGSCIQECSPGAKCKKECCGINVNSIATAQSLRGCTHIKGNLMVQMHSGSDVVKELESNLNTIQEISGFLKISRSLSIMSLNFLSSLQVIHGNNLEKGKYSLIVMNNENLIELWDWNSRKSNNFTIKHGTLFFHFNPLLCMSKIEELKNIAGLLNFSSLDVASESNGDKASCNILKLEVWVQVLYSTSVIIKWKPCNLPSCESIVQYMVYYIPNVNGNITVYDSRDVCCSDGWNVIDLRVPENRTKNHEVDQLLTQLKPYTQYAFYIKTYTKMTTQGRTEIQYFTTLPDRPSPPKNFISISNSSSEIVLKWNPPKHPNGKLSHYILSGTIQLINQKYLDQRNYCKNSISTVTRSIKYQGLYLNVNKTFSCCKEQIKPFEITDEEEYKEHCQQKTTSHMLTPWKTDACEVYFHRILHEGTPISLVLPESNIFPNKSMENSSTATLQPYQNKSQDGIYKSFSYSIKAGTHEFTVKNLLHFSEYTIQLMVCRKMDVNDESWNESLCSYANIINAKTLPSSSSDEINSHYISAETYNDTIGDVFLSWKSPRRPNGIIVAYYIEYRRTDIENSQPITECITRKQHDIAGGGFPIKNLPPGKYGFRLKSVSLAGESSFTTMLEYVVQDSKKRIQDSTLVAIIFTIIGISTLSGVAIYWRRKVIASNRSLILIATINPEYVSSEYVEDEWEVSKENVELLKELGQGSFGTVYEGIMKPMDVHCAVKTIADGASKEEKTQFLNEASVMKSFSGAHHIVKLLGVVSKADVPFVIMELMALGDLKSYLRASREESISECPDFQKMVLMAAQIADGMAFLEAKKFVHRDLAARNCMVASDFTVKIGDFGMTRDIYETDYYRNGAKGLLPVRWMAPESLKDGVFTCQSDVWSYGVVLWEIVTLAEQPYQGYSNEQVLQFVVAGGFLVPPSSCPAVFSEIMTSCWKARSYWRPKFVQILEDLEKEMEFSGNFRVMSFFHSAAGREAKAAAVQSADTICKTSAGNPKVTFFHCNYENDEATENSLLLRRNMLSPLSPLPEETEFAPDDSQYVLQEPLIKIPEYFGCNDDESEYVLPEPRNNNLEDTKQAVIGNGSKNISHVVTSGNSKYDKPEGIKQHKSDQAKCKLMNGTIRNGYVHQPPLSD